MSADKPRLTYRFVGNGQIEVTLPDGRVLNSFNPDGRSPCPRCPAGTPGAWLYIDIAACTVEACANCIIQLAGPWIIPDRSAEMRAARRAEREERDR